MAASAAAAAAAAGEDLAKLVAVDREVGGGSVDVAVPPVRTKRKKEKKGVISRIWRGVFGSRKEDYEKKLKYLSREEASVHARMKRRAVRSRKMARNIVLVSVMVEVTALAFAVMAVRLLELDWTMKIVRSLPAILLPGFSFVIYTTVARFTRMLDRKDQKMLERLRAETKEKLDELKERTNYYTTQQLIQRYDLDPTAKAAAASILASKMGSDSGLNVYLGDDTNANTSSVKNNDAELMQSSGLRNRYHSRSDSNGSRGGTPPSLSEVHTGSGAESPTVGGQSQMVVEHHHGPSPSDGGWIGRIAALLVGEDPSQSYALICGNCLRHNGLARKEDFPHITYYCPHCNTLNMSRSENESNLSSERSTPQASVDDGISPQASVDGISPLARNLSNASSAAGSEVMSSTPPATIHEEASE